MKYLLCFRLLTEIQVIESAGEQKSRFRCLLTFHLLLQQGDAQYRKQGQSKIQLSLSQRKFTRITHEKLISQQDAGNGIYSI